MLQCHNRPMFLVIGHLPRLHPVQPAIFPLGQTAPIIPVPGPQEVAQMRYLQPFLFQLPFLDCQVLPQLLILFFQLIQLINDTVLVLLELKLFSKQGSVLAFLALEEVLNFGVVLVLLIGL